MALWKRVFVPCGVHAGTGIGVRPRLRWVILGKRKSGTGVSRGN